MPRKNLKSKQQIPETLEFNSKFLNYIIVNSIQDTEFLRKIRWQIPLEVFKTKEKMFIMEMIYDHFDEYKTSPGDDFYLLFHEEKNKLSTPMQEKSLQLISVLQNIKVTNPQYILTTIRDALYHFAIEEALIKCAQLSKQKKYDEIKSIFLKALNKPEEVQQSYYNFFTDKTYMEHRSKGKQYKMKTLIPKLDEIIGGFMEKFIIVLLAATKGGKTKMCVEMGTVGVQQGLNVLHVTLENPKEFIDDAYDQCMGFLGDKPNQLVDTMEYKNGHWVKIKKVLPTIYDLDKVSKNRRIFQKQGGMLYISDQVGRNFNCYSLEALLDQLELEEGIIFDMIIIDWLGEMKAVHKTRNNKKDRLADNIEGIKDITHKRNLITFLPQQGNRKAMQAKVLNSDLIADGIEPIWLADLVLAFCQTKERSITKHL